MTALSKEQIVQAAIEILDAHGERGLTFRTLAANLDTGSGAIYWHLSGKGELLSAACDHIVTRALARPTAAEEPQESVRRVALALFDAIDLHPWTGSHLGHDPQELGLPRIIESLGTPLVELGVPEDALFDCVSALLNYILGVAQTNAANARRAGPDTDRDAFLQEMADGWTSLSPTTFPFVHRLADRMAQHDGRQQYLAGVDLILSGIRALVSE